MKIVSIIIVTLSWTQTLVKSQSTCATQTPFSGEHALGAVNANPDITNLQACMQSCIDDPLCNGYEFDTNPALYYCWYHYNSIDLTNLYDDNPTITLYTINTRFACTSGSSSISSTTTGLTSSTSGPTTTPGAGCANFVAYPGNHALGAEPLAVATSLQLCLNACVLNAQCTAYEYSDASGVAVPCWFHTNVVNPATDLYNDDASITIYIATRFPCTLSNSVSTTTGSTVSTTVTSVSTTTGPSAVPSICFEVFPNTNAQGAQQAPEAQNDDQCKTVCLGFSTCTAYESDLINPSQYRCWLHLAPLGELFNTNGVTINIRVPCSSSGSTTSAVTVSPGTQCVVFGNPLNDTQSIGATSRGNISDTACQNICIADVLCVAYEIDHVLPDRCWIHDNQSDLTVVYDTQFVTQYRVLSRVCSSSGTTGSSTTSTSGTTIPGVCANYMELPRTQTLNGIPQATSVNTQAACQDICTKNGLCVAYDIDTDPTSPAYCWIHTNPNDLLVLYDSNFVTEYQVIDRNCGNTGSSTTASSTSASGSSTSGSSGSSTSSVSTTSGSSVSSSSTTAPPGQCVVTWTTIPDMNQPGGTPNRASDLPSCQQACINNLYCVGIDVNSNDGNFFCFLITTNVSLASFPGNTHYTITRGANCITPQSTTASTSIPSSTLPLNPGAGCENFRVVVGYNADGGNMIGQMALSDCLVACIRDPTCFAIDYAVDTSLCFTHTSLSGAQLATCCVRYECASNPCQDTFAKYSDTSPNLSLGQVQSVTTQTDCQNACLTKNCSRFSFVNAARIPSQSCYLFFANGSNNAGREATTTQVGIDLYVRKRCIASPVVPPTTTPTIPPSLPQNYCPIDLVFVIDSSGSIRDNQPPGIDNWALIKSFMKDVVSTYLLVGQNTDHVAVVTFSDTAILNFNLNKYTDGNSVNTAIDNLPFIGYETNTPAALTLATAQFSDPSQGARNRSTKFTILVTDGQVSPQYTSQYQPAITLISQYSKARYAIGVTTDISTSELFQFTGNRDAYTTVLSFSDLSRITGLGIFLNSVDCNGNVILTSALTTTVSGVSSTTGGGGGSQSSTTSSGGGVGSSSTSISTTMTSTSGTTTAPGPPRGTEGTFGAITRTSTTGPANPVHYTTLVANRFNVYVTATDSFIATDFSGFYFIEICAGVMAGTTAELSTRGAYPAFSFAWLSTSQNGVVASCRSGVLSMTRGVRVYIQQTGGGLYSDNNVQTSWSIFSITDVINDPTTVLSAFIRTPVAAPNVIPFADPTANPQDLYDAARYQYICRTSGVYFFSFSAGVAGATTASVRLIGMNNVFEIATASNTHNSVISLDRAVVANCLNGRVSVQVMSGQITPGGNTENLISFQAFPYQLRDNTPVAAWGLYKTTSVSLSSTATDPLPFDLADVTQGVTYSNNAITLTLGGYYYVYVSAGCPAGQVVNLTLRRNSQVLFSVYKQDTNTNGFMTIGQGLVVLFNASDVLRVVAEANSAVYSTQDGLHTSFVGIRLYAPE